MAGSKAPDHQLRINDQGELTSQAVAGPAVEPHPQAILPSDDPEAVIPFIQLQRSLAGGGIGGVPRLPESPFRRAAPTTPADRAGAHVDCFPDRRVTRFKIKARCEAKPP